MTPLWDRLNDYAAHIRGKFQDNFTEYDEPAMADLYFKDWDDRFWHSDQVDKAHLKTIVPADGKGLWLMHVNVFPKAGLELPILGFDIVAGPKKRLQVLLWIFLHCMVLSILIVLTWLIRLKTWNGINQENYQIGQKKYFQNQ